jgi:hypothetical protein
MGFTWARTIATGVVIYASDYIETRNAIDHVKDTLCLTHYILDKAPHYVANKVTEHHTHLISHWSNHKTDYHQNHYVTHHPTHNDTNYTGNATDHKHTHHITYHATHNDTYNQPYVPTQHSDDNPGFYSADRSHNTSVYSAPHWCGPVS